MSDERDNEKWWKDFPSEVLKSSIVSVVAQGLLWLIGALAVGIFLLVTSDAELPVGVTVILLAVLAAAGYILYRRATKRLHERAKRLSADNKALAEQVDRNRAHSGHVRMMLDHLHKVIAGEVGNVSIPSYIEKGILQPARDMLLADCDCDVRLSILLPMDDDHFDMAWAAGHSFESQQKYHVPIEDTLSRFPLADGYPHEWGDVTQDPRFKRNPDATRAFRSLISIPIKHGADVAAIFNVIWEEPEAFSH